MRLFLATLLVFFGLLAHGTHDVWRLPEPLPPPAASCRLVLHLETAADEAPIGTVELWRIDLPETSRWTAGDERVARVAVPADGGVVLDRLPPGSYRIHAHDQRAGTDDPPAFELRDASTFKAFQLPGRRRHRVTLRIVKAEGEPVARASMQMEKFGRPSWTTPRPAWARWRLHRGPNGSIGIGGGAGGAFGARCGNPKRDVRATEPAGFDLGRHLEDGRHKALRRNVSLQVPRHSAVAFTIAGRLARDRSYLGVVVPLTEIHDQVFLPGGQRAVEQGARFRVHSAPVPMESGAEAVRAIPLQVEVRLEGFETLKYAFTLAEGAVHRTLVPNAGN